MNLDGKMKSRIIKIETEKKKKNKNLDKIKQLEIELVKLSYANNPKNLQSELKELKKFHVANKKYKKLKVNL